MTTSMEQAIERLRQVPEEQQDLIARLVLHEIDEEERWAKTTEQHSDKLATLVAEIVEADRRGECEPLDPEKL
jgi:hypothetical protein